VEQSYAGTAVRRRRSTGHPLFPALGAILPLLLSPERAHAADRPAPAAAAAPQGVTMPTGIADTPAARLLAAVRSFPAARLLAVVKSLRGEGTAVLPILSNDGMRTAVLSPPRWQGLAPDPAVLVPPSAPVAPTGPNRAGTEHPGTWARSYKPCVSPG